MRIHKPCVVSLTWKLSDAQGAPIDDLTEPVEFFFGGDDLLAKVEEALEGQVAGFDTHLHLEPEHAFGEYDSHLVCFEDRALFPAEVQAGMRFEGLPEGAATRDVPTDTVYTVTEVYPSHVVLDGNHPLAGMALRLHLTVCGVRQASDEEIDAGSVGSSAFEVAGVMPPPDRLQ
ncbi:MAG: peptidylprolyl isomerase [Aquincola sp.]|nr:peptidylprolyl isomerase [Aquincola sp.]MDH4289437.1 peptidylprolyl isomerase [Aquincola sp.]MDH5331263.1 peptidylprolyl isomerase [Aquincola sp.]